MSLIDKDKLHRAMCAGCTEYAKTEGKCDKCGEVKLLNAQPEVIPIEEREQEMNCKDCLHHKLCFANCDNNFEGNGNTCRYCESASCPNGVDCEYFEDESLFIKLPCKVGDIIYLSNHKKEKRLVVKGVYNNNDSGELYADSYDTQADSSEAIEVCCINFRPEDKALHVLIDEAEKVLKESSKMLICECCGAEMMTE